MMDGGSYLTARGWSHIGDRWYDPCRLARKGSYSQSEAIRIQVFRDEDCERYQKARMASYILEECSARNAAQ